MPMHLIAAFFGAGKHIKSTYPVKVIYLKTAVIHKNLSNEMLWQKLAGRKVQFIPFMMRQFNFGCIADIF